MTFDEVLDEMNANQEPSEAIRFMECLRDIYAPTVEMTKEEKQTLLDLKSRATFYFFNQAVKKWQQDRIGLQMPYGGLTEDELMQAWLHPESIKVTNEGRV